jgi:hypothetical protein
LKNITTIEKGNKSQNKLLFWEKIAECPFWSVNTLKSIISCKPVLNASKSLHHYFRWPASFVGDESVRLKCSFTVIKGKQILRLQNARRTEMEILSGNKNHHCWWNRKHCFSLFE